jgi:serine/threonine-protein kinase
MMRKLWPHEPARSRTEFARLLREARETLHAAPAPTPTAGPVSEGLAARMAPSDPSQLAGTPYRLGRKLGEGASGAVYEAEHVELERKLAVKILGPEHAASPSALARFRREARAVANLSHPNIVQLYDFGRSLDGRAFLAMELCVGQTLDARMREGDLTWREATRIAVEAAKALEAAHAAGLVHRDLKPQNLMLSSEGEPQVKLLDFGVATALTDSENRPASERERVLRGFAVFGTPEYMAPEQVAGDPVDGRSDLYALGCVLYEMLTRAPAFEGPSSVVVMGKQLHDTPLPPRARAPKRPIPRAVEAVVVRAMSKSPAARFPTASAMRAALESAREAPLRRRERARRVASALLMAAALTAAAVGSARWARDHAPTLETTATTAPPGIAAASSLPAAVVAIETAPDRSLPKQASVSAAPALATTSTPSLREARARAHAHPGSAAALDAWARAALRAGELREAHRAANAWTSRDGTVEPRLVMAEILDASGRRQEATALLTEWLQSHPDAQEARAALTRLTSEPVARR